MITVIFTCFMLLLHFQITDICRYLIQYKTISAEIITESFKNSEYHQLTRIVTSNLFHNNLHHILLNMIAFINIGIPIEDFFKTINKYLYFKILILLVILSGIINFIFHYLLFKYTNDLYYYTINVCGFSAVLFGLKFIFYHLITGDFNLSIQQCVLNLIIIYLLIPNSSILGHLSGLCSGIIVSKLIGI